MGQDTCIVTEELSVVYRKNGAKALDRVNLEVPSGNIFGLLGPNGAGKTTLLSVLCGVLRASSGTARVLGHELPREKEVLKERIGVVPQETALYPTLSIRENLLYLGRMHSIPEKELKERVRGLTEELQLADRGNERIEHLSGGMKRRVNLMAGLLHEPELLFLDEPTTGIDVHSRQMILERLKREREAGKTLIYSSHDLEEAEEICDRVAIMDEARIVRAGSTEELLRDPASSEGSLRKLILGATGSTETPSKR